MGKRLFFVLLASLSVCAQDRAPADEIFRQVRGQMSANLSRMPNYTCLQTIERKSRRVPSRRYELVDLVRLEVALVNGKELFSWPGAGNFEDKEIGEIVTGGAIGNGSFALHAKSLFQSRAALITPVGEVVRNNRRLLQWNYEVPQKLSGYTLRVGAREAIVGYHGTFWADPDSLDVTRLEIEADEIPPELHIARAGDAVEYQRIEIGGQSFLLPRAAELRMVDEENSESFNLTTFSGCRQYTGESVLVFTDPDLSSRPAAVVAATIEVPVGLQMELTLDMPISSDTSAVGDPVTAVLHKTVKKSGVTVLPKGALLHGRITVLRRQNGYSGYSTVGLDFFEIEFPGAKGSLKAELDQVMAPGNNIVNPGVPRPGGNARLEAALVQANLHLPGSVFFVRGDSFKLPRGLHMFWHTKTPLKEK